MPNDIVEKVLDFIKVLLPLLAVFIKTEDVTDRIVYLSVAGGVCLAISILIRGDWRWVLTTLMIFQVLYALYISHNILKPSQTDDGAECELVNESSCWMHTNNIAVNLSGEIDISHNNLVDEFFTYGLLSFNDRNRIALIISAEMEKNSLRRIKLRHINFNLLVCSFPKTGEKGYKSYCAILKKIPEYSKFGLRLCRLCEPCCVDLLNGTMLDNGSCSYPPVEPVQTSVEKNEVNLIMDDICMAAFVEMRARIKAALASPTVHETYVDTEHYDDTNPSVPVYEASLVCAGGRVLVSLIVGVDPDETTREFFQQVMSSALAVDPTMVDVSLTMKHSTMVLLRIPLQAGFELLSFRANRTLRKKVVESFASFLPSIQADYVSVQLQVSTMQPFRLFFCPRRKEKEEAATSLNDIHTSLRPESFATWSYDRTFSSIFGGVPVFSVRQVLYSSDLSLSTVLKWAAIAFVFAVFYLVLTADVIPDVLRLSNKF